MMAHLGGVGPADKSKRRFARWGQNLSLVLTDSSLDLPGGGGVRLAVSGTKASSFLLAIGRERLHVRG
jgi:hypothetical protein